MTFPLTLDQFELLVRTRRATRHFKPDPLPDGVLDRLLSVAQWAPSGYNLQPTHFVVVTDADRKVALYKACLKQKQVLEAPATIVFTGDRKVAKNHFDQVLALDLEAGAIDAKYERLLRRYVPLAFSQSPLGLGWLGKAIAAPMLSLFIPTPNIPAVHKQFWLTKQVMLTAMNFMLAATAAGLATVPMEGFDEHRVKRLLRIPSTHIVPIVIPVGYATDAKLKKTRLPLSQVAHRNSW